ncbi:MAG: aminodeoxychorismate synthase component I [Sphingomonas sp.]|nr:MAG: aminodeoxychorismate synthase component I [Sphingomonas sp.]
MAAAFDPALPFALLWDAGTGCARLFTAPVETLESTDIETGLETLRRWTREGDWAVGALSYEAGHQRESRLAALPKAPPWLRFTRHRDCRLLDAPALTALLAPFHGPATVSALTPLVEREDWLAAVRHVQALIAGGDIYQANLTFPSSIALHGHPLALFPRLFSPQAAPHGGVVHLGGGRWWISLSPELFFAAAGGKLTARPMKGTAPRGLTAEADAAIAAGLGNDAKNRAENLMITDLIRNDLARVSVPGSVRVPRLFEVERYPSLHQMTSTVTAELEPGRDALDVLAALHPCGSITGAPKIRAMQVIAETERHPRGLYTGSLGWIGPQAASARFAVAIRTLEVEGRRARLGLGAGIVADSDPEAEWAECLTKARFLQPSAPMTLIETMRLEPDGIPRLARHLDRLQRSALRFGFRLDRPALEARLAALPMNSPRRLRLLLDRDGAVALQLSTLPPVPDGPVEVALCPLPLEAGDWRLAHKTGDRSALDAARRASGAFECLFVRPDGLLTEGSYTSLFVQRDGRLLTPPLSRGLLPGVLREMLLAEGRAEEADLRAADLATGFFIGNSLRGLMPARLRPELGDGA